MAGKKPAKKAAPPFGGKQANPFAKAKPSGAAGKMPPADMPMRKTGKGKPGR